MGASRLWRREWDGRVAALAERVGWALRAAGYGYAVARLEQGSKAHTSLGKNAKGPGGAFYILAERVSAYMESNTFRESPLIPLLPMLAELSSPNEVRRGMLTYHILCGTNCGTSGGTI